MSQDRRDDGLPETQGAEEAVDETSGRDSEAGGSTAEGGELTEGEGLEERLEQLESEAQSYRDNLVRLQAEFENFKKRQVKEREESRRKANERLLKSILPVLDNLERAVDHGRESSDIGTILEGVDLVLKQLREGLLQFGVELIEAKGAEFDPHVHEAMSRVDTDGDPPDGTVVEVYQKGYLLNGRVLRPAMVAVAKLVDSESGEG